VRWAAILLTAVPIILMLLVGMAAAAQHNDFARACLRWLRYVLLLELILLLAAAAAGAIYERVSGARERALAAPLGNLVDIGGYRLHLYCTGQAAPTVVLEHGLDGSYLDWYFVQPEVARFARVCSFDRAGYGWSDPSPKPRLPHAQAEELHTLLETAGEKPPFVLVGHSMGSFDVLMYAHRYPEQVSGIVLVDGSHPDEKLPFTFGDKARIRVLQWTASLGLPRWRKWCEGGPEATRPLRRGFCYEPKTFRTQYQQWASFSESAKEVRDLWPRETNSPANAPLGNLPLVVISRDPKLGADNIRRANEERWQEMQNDLARLSSASDHLVAKETGHSIPTDQPGLVVEGIRKVVEQTRTKIKVNRPMPPSQ
jgi:pimeloyl-ACP methyl ester carboxylesterase